MRGKLPPIFGALFLGTFLAACATSEHQPSSSPTVPSGPAFSEIKTTPDSFRGQTLVLGGQVLHARRLQDGTRIEILQLPLTESQQPTPDLTKSQGRFMAVQREFLDPATIPHGTFVTVTGELTGSMTLPLDETEYTYPVLDIKDLRTWVPDYSFPRIRLTPYYSPSWHPYWGPYGRGYPYFW